MPDKLYLRMAGITLLLSLGLVALGGFVHNTGSSLACPDWPLCFGQVFPKMEGSVAIEHSHRLLATFVGVMVIGLIFASRRLRAQDPALFRGSWLALGLVVFQGCLGGATVLLGLSPLMSTAHLATSQIFLATILYLYLRARGSVNQGHSPASHRNTVLILAGLVYVQMLLGASIRHGGAGSLCGLGWDSALYCREAGFENVATLWPGPLAARFHMLHRYFGAGVGLAIWGAAARLHLRGLKVASFLVGAQIVLGVVSIGTFLGLWATTLHLFVAALIWICLLTTSWNLPRVNGGKR